MVRTVWQINPAIAVHLPERFKSFIVIRNEVTKLIRSTSRDVLDTPEALPFLLGDRIDSGVRRDLKVSGAIFALIAFSDILSVPSPLGPRPSCHC